jgi:glucose/arabinose dehydrogenase
LRINSDGTIPSDNPFFNSASGASRAIWALALRQPFSLDVQSGISNMFVNEVGENTWEEIDEVAAGKNYGWPVHEGTTSSPDPSLQNYQNPVLAYSHTGDGASTGCSITGGAFYGPATAKFPSDYHGDYFYADFCSGWIRSFDPATETSAAFATGIVKPVDLEVGENGSLYYLFRGSNSVSASVPEVRNAGV